MDFALNEQQEMLRNAARDFLKTECPKSTVRELEDSDSGHSPQLWKQMAGLDWMGIIVPEEYGGFGGTLLDAAVLFEEFGRAAMPGPMLATMLGTIAVLEGGTDALKRALLPEIIAGNMILTLGLDEPETIHAPKFIAARATRSGDKYVINGTKMFVPYANVADRIVVFARTKGRPGNESGITAFAVDAKQPGITLTAIKTIAADRQFQVDFADVRVSSDGIVGDLNDGLPLAQRILDQAVALSCAEIVGGAQQELEMTTEYTKTRVQFDRPIGTFQAVQHRLADMYIDVHAARWTTYQALWRLSEGLPASMEIALAKFITGKACSRIAFSAQQLHGGIGVDLDFDLQFYYRRQKALELRFGTSAFHLGNLELSLSL